VTTLTTSRGALVVGLALGAVFSILNVISAFIAPLEDDTLSALAAFYGPMFVAWGIAGFLASRSSERIADGVKAGTLVALGTFVVLTIVVIVRVNLSLAEVSQRPDWRNLVARFESSGLSSLRTYVNYIYLTGAPFKILVATSIGALFGLLGGCTSLVFNRRTVATAEDPAETRQIM
jgi:hypothetical protein